MKKLKLIAGTLLLSTFLFTACDGVLDTTPRQSIDADEALTSAENVKSTLIGAYDAMSDGDLYGGWFLMMPDLLAAGQGEITFSGTFLGPRQIARKEQQYDNANVTDTWIEAYNTINTANTVLDNLDLIDASEVGEIEGQAKFIRGMIYFDLVRLYATQYVSGGPNDAPGVPIVLTPTSLISEDDQIERSTVGEVYQRVLDDLQDAKDLLPNSYSSPNENLATSMAASAVLSRVYLQIEDYENARIEADRVISSGFYTLATTNDVTSFNYSAAFNNDENSSEDIFAIQVSDQDGTNSLNTFYNIDPAGRGDMDINQVHLDEYETNDERLNLFYYGDGAVRSGKWRSIYGNVQQIRLAEMYLTRAEANFREGAPFVGPDPVDDINEVRDRVGLDPLVTVTLDDILQERKLELMFEGQLLHDLKRTQRNVGTRTYDDPKLVLPIPRREIDSNPNLCQNASYQGPSC